MLATLSRVPAIRDASRADECKTILAEFLGHDSRFVNFGVIDRAGMVRCSAVPASVSLDLSDRRYFSNAIETRRLAIGEYQIGRITGKSSLNFGYPILDRKGEATAVVFAAVRLDRLAERASALPGLGQAVTVLIDHAETVLARHPDSPAWAGKSVAQESLVQQALLRGERRLFRAPGLDGVERLYVYVPLATLPTEDVHVLVGVPETEIFADLNRRFTRDLILLSAAASIAGLFAWWGGGVLVLHPVRALSSAARRLGQGDLSARTGLRHVSSELGQLARTFDGMAEALEGREAELYRIHRTLKTLSTGNRTLLHAESEPELLEAMCRVPVEVGGFPVAWIAYAVDRVDAGKAVRLAAHAGVAQDCVQALEQLCASAAADSGVLNDDCPGRPCVVGRLRNDPTHGAWRDAAMRLGMSSAVALPLCVDGMGIGLFVVGAEQPDAFGPKEVALLSEMADDLSYGIGALRTREHHRKAEAALEHLAFHDALTGLPNRLQLSNTLDDAITNGPRQQPYAVLVLDLDRFREINDTLGYEQGNVILRSIGPKVSQVLQSGQLVGRVGQDEFGVLLPGCDAEAACSVAQDIEQVLKQPVVVRDLQLDVRASMGIAVFPDHGGDADALLRCAGRGVLLARKAGDGFAIGVGDSREAGTRRLTLSSNLHHAIENGELSLYCQPKVQTCTGEICGVEALLRWSHAEFGMVPPGEFIALAEHTGLIKPLTYWVLDASVRQCRRWLDQGLKLPVAVNLSAYNLRDTALVETVERALETWGVAPQLLHLELTESGLMEDPDRAWRILARLHELGIKLFIDDFGTGYSSLSYLQKLPVDAIKIDRAFVMAMSENEDSAVIVRSTIELAHGLGMKVVAEGVEDQNAWDRLEALGCDEIQGFFVSRPMPADDVLDWVAQSPGSARGAE